MKRALLFLIVVAAAQSVQAQIIGNYTANKIIGGTKPSSCNFGPPPDVWLDTATSPPTMNTCKSDGTFAAALAGGAPPTGSATGDLSGSYPNPTVAKVNGAAVPTSTSVLASNGSNQLIDAVVVPNTYGGLGVNSATAITTANVGNQSSASCTNITNMSWNIAANKNYMLECHIIVALAASATVQFCLNGPGSPAQVSLFDDGAIGASSAWAQFNQLNAGIPRTTWGDKTTASSAVATTSDIHVWAGIQNGATASGTALTLQTAANGTNNINVQMNSTCTLKQVN